MSKKRKQKKVAWVVFVGRIIGIHESWDECERAVNGYPGAKYKSYKIYEDAIAAWERFEEDGVMDVKAHAIGSSARGDKYLLKRQDDDREDIPSQSELQLLVLQGKRCAYCAAPTLCVDSAEVYHGKSYGPIWICRPCSAYVGCHKGTTNALGRVANAELRKKKMAFHAAFDPLWKSGKWNRNALYAELAKRMNIDKELCHGGMFDVKQCDLAISTLKSIDRAPAKAMPERANRPKGKEDPLSARAQALVDTLSTVHGTGSVITNCSCWPNCLHAEPS
jgi:hypothetical protein